MPDFPFAVWIALAGVLGLLVGSFLNVVILRLPERMAADWRREARDVLELEADARPLPPGIVREPSHCPQCKHPLSALDNIPLFGWLLLRGRCRYCKAKISIQYPLVELLSAVLSAVIVWKFGPSWAALAGLVLTWTLIALSGIDFRTQLLPDQLTFPLLWLGLLLALLPMFVTAPSAIIGADFTDAGHTVAVILGVLVSRRFSQPIHWTPVLALMLVASSGFGFLVLAHHWGTMAAAPVAGALGALVAYQIARFTSARGSQPAPIAADDAALTGPQPVLAG